MSDAPLEGLAQPDARSCGAACVVAARILAGTRAASGPRDFAAEVLATHRRLTSCRGVDGRLQLPWPRSLGTPPWAVARALAATTGRRHRVRVVRDRAAAYALLATGLGAHQPTADSPVVAYVGNRWLPRHVVLVLSADADGIRVYEPSAGQVVHVDRQRWVDGPLRLAGWDRPWLLVRPT